MKTLFFECRMGAAGDMLMGALLELIPNREEFLAKLNSLGLPGVAVNCETAVRCGITGSHIRVTVGGEEEHEHIHDHCHGHEHEHIHDHCHGHEHEHADEHKHVSHDREHDAHERTRRQHDHSHADEREHPHASRDHSHAHEHFSFADIQSLVGTLPLSDKVKSDALSVYRLIGDAESSVHGVPVEQIHFHEVGSLDAVADVIGCCMLLELLCAESIVASPICTGSGTVRCAHGILPVPAPATARLLLGIPCFSGNIESELCTPTGAALLRHFVTRFGVMPPMTVERIGYGMGTKDFPAANCVRAFLGEAVTMTASHSGMTASAGTANGTIVERDKDTDSDAQLGMTDEIYELCCNLDDMTPEAIGYVCELLLRDGALDVFTIPIQMKKSRPAVMLTCLCRLDDKEKLSCLMLLHTTTLGVRSRRCERNLLSSEHIVCETEYGKVRVKISEGYGIRKCKAEYDDVKAAAERCGVPFQTVATAATASIKDCG